MKNIIALFVTLFSLSCASHKMCDSSVPDKKLTQQLYSKRYKQSLHERDSLCNQSKQLATDTTSLGKFLRAEKKKLAEQIKEYNNLKLAHEKLKETTGEQLTKLSDDLTKRGIELEEKQKKVDQLEKVLAERQALLDNLFSSLKKALIGFSPSELTVEMKDGKLYVSLLDKLLFKSGSVEVETRGVEALQKLAEVLNASSNLEILVEGHTDNVAIKTDVYRDNWDLSTYRATSVVRILINNKVDVKRLTASGKGEFHPIASNDTAEGKSKNRRTEIILVPDLTEILKLVK